MLQNPNKMDSSTKKACLEEISFLVLDSEKKVSVNTISNNWDVPMKKSQELLNEWIELQKGKEFTKEYLVQGIDFDGNCFISLVSDKKLDFVKSKMEKMGSNVYSIETSSNSKRLEIQDLVEVKMMRLVIKTEERDLEAIPEPEPIREEIKPAVKVNKPSMFAPVKKEEKSPKKVSPKKESPKETIKPVASKGIASFFSAKPATTNGSKKIEETKKEKVSPEVKTEKTIPKVVEKKKSPLEPKVIEKKKTPETKEEKKKPVSSDKKTKTNKKTENLNSLKRTLAEINGSEESDEEAIPGTPQEKKVVQNRKRSRPAKSTKNESKNTKRIVTVDSSSDEEMEVIVADDDVEEIKEEPVVDVNKNESKKAENGSKKRCIRKRMVPKTYEDDDGYFSELNQFFKLLFFLLIYFFIFSYN